MKEVKYVELVVKRMALFDHEDTIPVHYWPSVLCVPVNEDKLLVDLEDCVKRVDCPIMHISEAMERYINNYLETEVKDFYICYSPEAEEVIGKPAKEISRLQKALKDREQSVYALDREIIEVKSRLRKIQNFSFWQRLKFLFKWQWV